MKKIIGMVILILVICGAFFLKEENPSYTKDEKNEVSIGIGEDTSGLIVHMLAEDSKLNIKPFIIKDC